MRRRAAQVLAVGGLCLAVVALRVVLSARAALRAADAALAAGDVDEAVWQLRRTARWYAPASPYPGRALQRLEAIAERAEAGGEIRGARRAREAERAAILETRSFYTPFADRLALANRHIAALLAREEGDGADPGKTETERAAWHQALLDRDEAPRPGWTALALLGFCGWVAGALAFLTRGLDADDRLRPRAALWSAAAIVAGYAAFLLGLARA